MKTLEFKKMSKVLGGGCDYNWLSKIRQLTEEGYGSGAFTIINIIKYGPSKCYANVYSAKFFQFFSFHF